MTKPNLHRSNRQRAQEAAGRRVKPVQPDSRKQEPQARPVQEARQGRREAAAR